MSIRIEYIVCNKKGDELNRFDVKSEAEAYDSVICAAEDISLLLEPIQKKLSLSDDQIYAISEHLAFQSDEIKVALKQIKKPKQPAQASTTQATEDKAEVAQINSAEKTSAEKTSVKKSSVKKTSVKKTSVEKLSKK